MRSAIHCHQVVMSIRLVCFVLLSIVHVLAHRQEQQPDESSNSANNAQSACSIELIWPPSNSIVLLATDSQSVIIYLKAMGDCSQDVRPDINNFHAPSLYISVAFYENGQRNGINNQFLLQLQTIAASPLDEDKTPVHYRLMRSPLLVKSKSNNLHQDTSGHHVSKEFSIWCFNMIYPTNMRNNLGLHDLDSDHLIFEVHLLSSVASKPVELVTVPSSIFYFRLLNHPSSHFYRPPPRYNTCAIPTNVSL